MTYLYSDDMNADKKISYSSNSIDVYKSNAMTLLSY